MLVLSLKLRYHSGMKKNAWLACACNANENQVEQIYFSVFSDKPFDFNDDETAGPKCSTTTTVT